MDNAVLLANQVFIMFLLIAVGYVLYRIRMVDEQTTDHLTKILLYIVTPSVIIQTYQVDYTKEKGQELLLALGLSAVAMAIGVVISFLVYIKKNRESWDVEQFAVCFSNTGFMGIPLVTAIMGVSGIFYSNTYMMVFQFMCWTFGLYIMRRGAGDTLKPKELVRIILNPTVLCIVVGIALFFVQIRLPKPVGAALDYLASMNTPLAMLVSGMCMAKVDMVRAVARVRNYYILFLKLLMIPLGIILAFRILPGADNIKLAILIVAACPTATNTMLFANLNGRDVGTASSLFTLSTLCSIITLPLVILLYSVLG